MINLHIFRRDLRLVDNTALWNITQQGNKILPAFIFDPRQLSEQNKYFSQHAFQFMLESLSDLEKELEAQESRLVLFRGSPIEVVRQLGQVSSIQSLSVNRDYTPFSRRRDKELAEIAQQVGLAWQSFSDALLAEPEEVSKDDGTPYQVFTPFWKKARQHQVRSPHSALATNTLLPTNEIEWLLKVFSNENGVVVYSDTEHAIKSLLPKNNSKLWVQGGRTNGITGLQQALPHLNAYKARRDVPSDEQGTSSLSPHHKFGTLSVRESYWAVREQHGESSTYLTELYWRDFYAHIAWHFPRVFGQAFQLRYEKVEWDDDQEKFQQWCEGKTGFPIVDAGIRQLNQTGYMHNRVRMIVASFLTKDLHIDWRWGEQYFATKLIDYDPCSNNGGWQWAASTGCDAQPYFRIFNPWSQQQKFDPEVKYIHRWVPELADANAQEIHGLEKKKAFTCLNYVDPMISHAAERIVALERYQKMKL